MYAIGSSGGSICHGKLARDLTMDTGTIQRGSRYTASEFRAGSICRGEYAGDMSTVAGTNQKGQ